MLGRFIARICITFVVVAWFLVGVSQYPDPNISAASGTFYGFASAVCWGLTAVTENPARKWRYIAGWNGIFNALAAAFAALAVGYLMPKEACNSSKDIPLIDYVCSYRPPQ